MLCAPNSVTTVSPLSFIQHSTAALPPHLRKLTGPSGRLLLATLDSERGHTPAQNWGGREHHLGGARLFWAGRKPPGQQELPDLPCPPLLRGDHGCPSELEPPGGEQLRGPRSRLPCAQLCRRHEGWGRVCLVLRQGPSLLVPVNLLSAQRREVPGEGFGRSRWAGTPPGATAAGAPSPPSGAGGTQRWPPALLISGWLLSCYPRDEGRRQAQLRLGQTPLLASALWAPPARPGSRRWVAGRLPSPRAGRGPGAALPSCCDRWPLGLCLGPLLAAASPVRARGPDQPRRSWGGH